MAEWANLSHALAELVHLLAEMAVEEFYKEKEHEDTSSEEDVGCP